MNRILAVIIRVSVGCIKSAMGRDRKKPDTGPKTY